MRLMMSAIVANVLSGILVHQDYRAACLGMRFPLPRPSTAIRTRYRWLRVRDLNLQNQLPIVFSSFRINPNLAAR
jgi:hypothetical protein